MGGGGERWGGCRTRPGERDPPRGRRCGHPAQLRWDRDRARRHDPDRRHRRRERAVPPSGRATPGVMSCRRGAWVDRRGVRLVGTSSIDRSTPAIARPSQQVATGPWPRLTRVGLQALGVVPPKAAFRPDRLRRRLRGVAGRLRSEEKLGDRRGWPRRGHAIGVGEPARPAPPSAERTGRRVRHLPQGRWRHHARLRGRRREGRTSEETVLGTSSFAPCAQRSPCPQEATSALPLQLASISPGTTSSRATPWRASLAFICQPPGEPRRMAEPDAPS